ncbi:hypothetical protein Tco_0451507 [Tanacetum coccineum]
MAELVCLEKLAMAAKSRKFEDQMIMYIDQSIAEDVKTIKDLKKVLSDLVVVNTERRAFTEELERLKYSANAVRPWLPLEEKNGYLVNNASSIDRLGIAKYNWWSEALHGLSSRGLGTFFSDLVPGATSFSQVILIGRHSMKLCSKPLVMTYSMSTKLTGLSL